MKTLSQIEEEFDEKFPPAFYSYKDGKPEADAMIEVSDFAVPWIK